MTVMQPERYCKRFSAVDNRRRANEANQRAPSLGGWRRPGYEIAARTFATVAREREAWRALGSEES